jgi:hypothetical protein
MYTGMTAGGRKIMQMQISISTGPNNKADWISSFKLPNYYRGMSVVGTLRQSTMGRDIQVGHNDGTSWFNLDFDGDGTLRGSHNNPDGSFSNCDFQGIATYISTLT